MARMFVVHGRKIRRIITCSSITQPPPAFFGFSLQSEYYVIKSETEATTHTLKVKSDGQRKRRSARQTPRPTHRGQGRILRDLLEDTRVSEVAPRVREGALRERRKLQ